MISFLKIYILKLYKRSLVWLYCCRYCISIDKKNNIVKGLGGYVSIITTDKKF